MLDGVVMCDVGIEDVMAASGSSPVSVLGRPVNTDPGSPRLTGDLIQLLMSISSGSTVDRGSGICRGGVLCDES